MPIGRSSRWVLLGLALLAGGGTVWWLAGADGEKEVGAPGARRAEAPGGGAARTQGPTAPVAGPVLAGDAPGDGRAAVPGEARGREALGEDEHIWLAGRVLLPAGVPAQPGLRVTGRIGRTGEARIHGAPVDGAGRFRLGLPLGARRVLVEVDGEGVCLAQPLEVELSPPPEELVLEPLFGARLLVRLVPPPGHGSAGLEGAEVRVWIPAQHGLPRQEPADADARGVARFACLPPVAVRVSCTAPGFADVLIGEPVLLHAGLEREHEVVLELEARLRGRVVDEDGAGVAGAALGIQASGALSTWTADLGPTDERGNFDLRGLIAGRYTLTVKPVAHLDARLELGELRAGDLRDSLEVVVGAGQRIGGRATWPDGSPAEGVAVRADAAEDGGPLWGSSRTTLTDSSGAFAIGGLREHAHRVSASAVPPAEVRRRLADAGHLPDAEPSTGRPGGPLFRARLESVAPGGPEIVLVLTGGEALRGRVTDAEGLPFEAARVTARRAGDGTLFGAQILEVRDPRGDFEWHGLMPGTYELFASGGAGRGESVRLELPWQGAPVPLTAPRGGRAEGLVLAPAGPVEGAEVTFSLAPADRARAGDSPFLGSDFTRNATTGALGHFELAPLAAGTHLVTARKTGVGRSLPREVEVGTATTTPRELVLELLPVGWIEGSLAPELGRIARRFVSVRGGPEDRALQATTDDLGRFELGDLLPGTYRLSVDAFGAEGHPSAAVAEVLAGRATRVELTGGHGPVIVHGRVSAGGEPVADLRAQAIDAARVLGEPTRTDAQGRFELELAVPGRAVFFLGDAELGAREARVVPPGDVARLDFELPSGAIRGLLLGQDGSPAAFARVGLQLDTEGPRHTVRRGRADAEGRFVLEHVEPGRYLVEAGGSSDAGTFVPPAAGDLDPDARHGYARSEPFDLAPGQRQAEHVLRLPAASTIRGHVRLADGSVPEEVALQAVLTDGPTRVWVAHAQALAGQYRLRGLGPGTYQVHASQAGAQGGSHQRSVTLEEGQELILDLTLE